MLTRRRFVQAAGAASLAIATDDGSAQNGGLANVSHPNSRHAGVEPTYLGLSAEEWLTRLFDRNSVPYDRFDELVESPREQIHLAVAAFGELVLPELERALNRRPADGRSAALRVLARMGTVGKQVLIAATTNPRGYVRAEAVSTLARNLPEALELPDLLRAALDDDVPEVRKSAAEALWYVRTDAKPLLLKALRHGDPAVRYIAAKQIVRIDPDPSFAEPLLIELLEDADLEVRWAAVQNVFCLPPIHPRVVPVLLQLIEEGLLAAANYLPFARAAGLRETLLLLQTENVALRAAAATALAEFVCGCDAKPCRNARELLAAEATDILLACQSAVQDNDLAVRMPAQRVVTLLEPRVSEAR